MIAKLAACLLAVSPGSQWPGVGWVEKPGCKAGLTRSRARPGESAGDGRELAPARKVLLCLYRPSGH
jgi:hypothetical protein